MSGPREPTGLIEGLAGKISLQAPAPADAHRRRLNKINLCEKDSWQRLEGKYKTLEKFIYRIFTETGTSSTKKKKKKVLQKGMSVLPGRHVFSQWWYVSSGACRFQYSIDMNSNWNVWKHHCGKKDWRFYEPSRGAASKEACGQVPVSFK